MYIQIKKCLKLSLIGLFGVFTFSCSENNDSFYKYRYNYIGIEGQSYKPEDLEDLFFDRADADGVYGNKKIEASGAACRPLKCLEICDKPLPNVECNGVEIVKAKYSKIVDSVCKMVLGLLSHVVKHTGCDDILSEQKKSIHNLGNNLKKLDDEQVLLKNSPTILSQYWFNLNIRYQRPKQSYDKGFDFNSCFKNIINSSGEWEKFIDKVHCMLNAALVKHPKEVLVRVCQNNNKNELAKTIEDSHTIKNCLDSLKNAMSQNKVAFQKIIFGDDPKRYFGHALCFVNDCISFVLKDIPSFRPLLKDLKQLTSAYLREDPTGLAFRAMLTFIHNQRSFVVGRIDTSIKNEKNKSIIENLCVDYNDLVGVGCLGMNIIMNCGIGLKHKKKVTCTVALFKAYVKLLKHLVVDILGTGDVDKIIRCLS